MIAKAWPSLPAVRLPPEVEAVARYVAAHHGLQEGVALAAILTAAGAIAGGARRILWRDRFIGLNLQFVVSPGAVAESPGWLHLITAPLETEVARLQKAASGYPQLGASLRYASDNVKNLEDGNPGKAEAARTFKRLAEYAFPYLCLSTFPAANQDDALYSTLVADASGKTIHAAIQDFGETEFLRLVADDSATARRLSLLLVAPPELVAALKRADILPGWCPLVVPQSGGVFAAPGITKETAEVTWGGVVKKLLAIRRTPNRCMLVPEAGLAVLNTVKASAEAAASRLGQAKWFPWAVGTCAKLAGILHTLNTDEDCDVSEETWDDAQRLTQWLIAVQAWTVGGFSARLRGVKARFHPPRPDDNDKIKAMMRARPNAKYRELVWNLPKRPPGYWKKYYVIIKGVKSRQNPEAEARAFDAGMNGDP